MGRTAPRPGRHSLGSGSLLQLCLIGQARVHPSPENRLGLLQNSRKHRWLPDPHGRACFSGEAGMATTVARPARSWLSFPIQNPLPAVPPDLCSVAPEILVPAANKTLELALGSRVALNCTVRWAAAERCEPVPAWTKDGQWLGSESSQDTAW